MADHKNTIKLNGKLYDAQTGKPISAPKKVTHEAKPEPKTIKPTATESEKKPPAKSDKHETKVKPSTTHPVKHIAHHKPQKAKTLMRSVVKKPDAKKIHAQTVISDNSTVELTSTPEIIANHSIKEGRSKGVSKSKLITKFGALGSQPAFVAYSEPVPVKQPPEAALDSSSSQNTERDSDMFAMSLKKVDEYNRKNPKTSSKSKKLSAGKMAAIATSSLCLVIIGAYVISGGPKNIEMKLAANKAGINAELPDYKVSGYSASGPIQYSPGQVVITYKSNSDERSYSVSQRSSSWNDQALLSNSVLGASTSYQTIESKGRTVYIYNESKASWVENGIWYEIDGGDSLNTAQIMKIVDSL